MTTDQSSNQQEEKKPIINSPLVNIANKFGGQFWEETQKEIQRSRKIEKEKIKKLVEDWTKSG